MGRAPCCDKTKVKRGPWSPEEDSTLKNYVENYGTGGNWIALPQKAGLKRCGKSCRLRWLNYLRPNIKHGGFTEEEDRMILSLYRNIGSRWSVIASQLPGRTDNDVKNYWNTKLKKKLLATSPPPPPSTTISSTMPPHYFITNSFNSFDQPYDSEFDFPVDTSNMLPYYPMESNQEMFISQFPLPGGIDVVAGNPPYNGGLLLPAADPLHYPDAVSSFSPPFSWSSGEESFLVAELQRYNLPNAVDFHENLDHFTCVGGSTDHFVNIG